MKHILKAKKRFLCLLLAGALAACLSPAALAAPDGVEVAPGYDYTRFKDAGITLNVYNWGEYIDEDVEADDEAGLCAYVSEDGARCRNHARPGSHYCGVHADLDGE